LSRRIVLIWLAACALTLAPGPGQASAQPAAHRADGDLSDWVGDPTMLAGETRVSRGELIYDDYLYDDYGADLDNGPNQPSFRDELAPTRGDYRYPTDAGRYGYNAADLRELRVAADGYGLHFLVFLQTMKVRDAAIVTIAIDGGRGRSTQKTWPHGVGIDSPAADRFITFWGTGGWITDFRGQRERIRRQAVNLDDNAIEVDVPWSSLGRIRDRTVRMYAVTGLADPARRAYLSVPTGTATQTAPGGGQPGSTAVFDAGFDGGEVSTRAIGSHWGEEVQSRALASRDVSGLGEAVDLSELEEGVSDNFTPQTGHFYDRIFRSGEDYGEGIELKNDPSQPGGYPDPQFLSPYQPYGLYVPKGYAAGTPTGLLINGHSLDVNHNEYAVVSPSLFTQLGDNEDITTGAQLGPRRFVITPLARGMDTWYINAGFKDVLEAWDDVKANYSIDDERTFIGGYSMGGYLTYRMGLLMPDKFAAAAAYVGPPAYQLWAPPNDPEPTGDFQFVGQTNNIVSNGWNLPFEINDGGVDELVPVAGARQQAQTFFGIQNPHLFYLYPTLDHFALILADRWDHTQKWLNDHPTRPSLSLANGAPDEVKYKRYPAMDLPQYGLRFDGAYWVDGMVVRSPGDDCPPPPPRDTSCEGSAGQVSAFTIAHGHVRSSSQEVHTTYAGPPAPASVDGINRIRGSDFQARNFFDAVLYNLSAITFDVGPMGIDPNTQITVHLTTDDVGRGQFTLTLRGNFPPVTATIRETPFGQVTPLHVTQTADGIELNFELKSQHDLTITPQ
jgi:hypothetical protein